jgi:23S rRNA (uracil1939-C5)-methyltransferase
MSRFKTGDRVEAKIESVAFGGDGVARVRDMVLFVPFTVDGDTAVARITDVKKTFLRGKLEKLVTASLRRIAPKCPYYLRCGGCQYQHIDYGHQLELKQKQVVESFRRIGRFSSPPVRDIIPSPLAFGYRGKAEFHLAQRRGNPPQTGFMDVTGSRIVDIERCEIMDETINAALAGFRRDLLTGRTAFESGGIRIFWSGISRNPLQEEEETGEPRITRVVKGRELLVSPEGFFQANLALVDRLVDAVFEMSALRGEETVLDLYAGVGLFSLFLADRAGQVIAVEMDGEAVCAARKNFERFGRHGAMVHEGDTAGVLRGPLKEKKGKADLIILDPPRTGCEKDVLAILAEWRPKRLIYISCDPVTQARDIRHLVDQGFSLQVLQPFDMFPQTKHIEVVALLADG